MNELVDHGAALNEEAKRIEQLIAAELHETVCQSLAGSGFFVKILQAQAESGQPVKTADLKKLNGLIEAAMADLRTILPVGFSSGGKGLVLSLQNLSNLVGRTAVCRLNVQSRISFKDPRLGETLFSLVRQAIRYALKSGSGINLQIDVRQNGGLLRLAVRFSKGSNQFTLSSEEMNLLRRIGGSIEIGNGRGVLISLAARVGRSRSTVSSRFVQVPA